MEEGMKKIASMYAPSYTNIKTGECIAQYVGTTREESIATCEGCELLGTVEEKGPCYSQWGTVAWSHSSMIKSHSQGRNDYSFEGAIQRDKKERDKKSRQEKKKQEKQIYKTWQFIRLGAIGDPSATSKKEIAKIRKYGLPVIGYTHFWEGRGSHLRDICLASCGSVEEADLAVANGWRATIIVPKDYDTPVSFSPKNNRIVLCVNAQNKKFKCSNCLLCVAGDRYMASAPIIALQEL